MIKELKMILPALYHEFKSDIRFLYNNKKIIFIIIKYNMYNTNHILNNTDVITRRIKNAIKIIKIY